MESRKGRPRAENPKTERLFIRVTPDEKREIQDFSQKSGVSLLKLLKKGIETMKK